tara:strand:- start:1020 stop:1253 length:234 start_codon:yes stop_codon:yes gene_type:complete
LIVIDKHSGVFVKSDVTTIGTAAFFACSDYNTANNVTFFHASAGNGIFNGRYEDIAYRRVASSCATEDANTENFSGT